MSELLWLMPTFPFAGFLILVLCGSRLHRQVIAVIGTGTTALSAFVASLVGVAFILNPPSGNSINQMLWTWMDVGGFNASISFYIDALSLVMVLVVTWISFLIHLYTIRFMEGDEGYGRFFAYMNLFVGSMLVLVLADNLLFFYLGWEGVGLCSYLLIGFWYREEKNARAAVKAFIVTRIGDAALAVGLFLLYNNLGTLNIQEVMARASLDWQVGSGLAAAAAFLILAGATAKSAQMPLHTWLPDAMAGPTPVSALIHAATMVTAGVYLVARTHSLFELAPAVQSAMAVIGAVTLLLAGAAALAQKDIKRILAYSTMSQIGYMFLALGVGAWTAAIFHFTVHACFKALLFLSAGVVIKALNDEHDIFKMGGLKKQLPLAFWTSFAGVASLSAIPFVTAGFYSKDLIVMQSFISAGGGPLFFATALTGSFITCLYGFRLLFVVFLGEARTSASKIPSLSMTIPLAVLAVLSLIAGYIQMPAVLGGFKPFSEFLSTILPSAKSAFPAPIVEWTLLAISSIVSLAGVYAAYLLYVRKPVWLRSLADTSSGRLINDFALAGWGFDRFYDRLFVRPFVSIAHFNKNDFVDLFCSGTAVSFSTAHGILTRTQSGNLRLYALAIAFGAVLFIGLVVLW